MNKLRRGIIKTIIWTQLHEAILADTGITLPDKAGPKTTKIIEDCIENLSKYLAGTITIVQGPIPTIDTSVIKIPTNIEDSDG